MRKHLGTLKVMSERLASYVSIINFGMILYLYVIESPLGVSPVFWVVAALIIIPLIVLVDWRVVYPASLKVIFGNKNKEFTELREDVRSLHRKIDRLTGERRG